MADSASSPSASASLAAPSHTPPAAHAPINNPPKFEGKDYAQWKDKFMAYIDLAGYGHVIDAMEEAAKRGATEAAQLASSTSIASAHTALKNEQKTFGANAGGALFTEGERRVYGALVIAMGTPGMSELVRAEARGDALGVWRALERRYNSKSLASKAQLQEELLSMRMESAHEPADLYVARIRSAARQLREMGVSVDESQLRHVFLKGLPAAFESLTQTFHLMQNLTFDQMEVQLIAYQEREFIKERQSARGGEESLMVRERKFGAPSHSGFGGGANYVGKSASSGGHQHGGAGGQRCQTCGKPGHTSQNCWQKNKKKRACYFCGEEGHLVAQCEKLPFRPGAQQQQQRAQAGHAHIAVERSTAAQQQQQQQDSAEQAECDDGDDLEFCCLTVVSKSSDAPDVALALFEADKDAEWILDTGCTRHLCRNKDLMRELRAASKPIPMSGAFGVGLELHSIGSATVLPLDSRAKLHLHDVAYDPRVQRNLLSVARLADKGLTVTFGAREALLQDKCGRTVLRVPKIGNLYIIRSQQQKQQEEHGDKAYAAPETVSAKAEREKAARKLQHERMGHISMSGLQRLVQANAVKGLPPLVFTASAENPDAACDSCELGKAHRVPFAASKPPEERAKAVLERVSGDVCGPVLLPTRVNEAQELTPCAALGGYKYVSTLIDEYSGKVFLQLVKAKSDVAAAVLNWMRKAQNKQGKKLKVFHTDGGGEYKSKQLQAYMEKNGIVHTTTQAYTPQHNGAAERLNRTLFNLTRSVLLRAKLPPEFWCEIMMGVVYLWNRCHVNRMRDGESARLKTPEERWSGRIPTLSHLRVLGSDCHFFVDPAQRSSSSKLQAPGKRGILLGYDATQHGTYRVFDLEGQQVVCTRHVRIDEGQFTFRGELLSKAMGMQGAYSSEGEETLEEILDSLVFESELRAAINISAEEAKQKEQSGSETQAADRAGEQAEDSAEASQPEPSAVPPAAAAAASLSSPFPQSASPPQPESTAAPKVSTAASAPQAKKVVAQKNPVSAKPPAVPAPRADTRLRASAAKASGAYKETSLGVAAASVRKGGNGGAALALMEDGAETEEAQDAATSADASELPLPSLPTAPYSGLPDPTSYREAMQRPDSAQWKAAMDAEMEAHRRNGTWRLIRLPHARRSVLPLVGSARRPLGNKWVFKTKLAADGSIAKYKARLVAQGFTQVAGVDYHLTYAPVLKGPTLRLLLTLAAKWDYELKQMDVQTAFLNADMEEEVYMRQPEGYEVGDEADDEAAQQGRLVCQLMKTLYGTKQASRAWNKEVDSFITAPAPHGLGYTRCKGDACLYWRRSASGRLMLFGLFVDDTVSAYCRSDESEWLELKSRFLAKYASTDLGDVQLLLGMRVTRDRQRRTLRLDQEVYSEAVLKQFHMQHSKPMPTPEQSSVKRGSQASEAASEQSQSPLTVLAVPPAAPYPDDESLLEDEVDLSQLKHRYQSAVGSLLYAAMYTRPDLLHAVNQLSRHLQSPSVEDWTAVKRALRYLRGTSKLGLVLDTKGAAEDGLSSDSSSSEHAAQAEASGVSAQASGEVILCGWSDADWAGSLSDRKSTTGFLLQLYGCPLVWQSKRQATVAQSTAEAEYMAVSALLREVKWLHQLLSEIGVRKEKEKPLHYDDERVEAEDAAQEAKEKLLESASPSFSPATPLYCDNQSTVAMCHAEGDLHRRTKHIDVRHHWIRSAVQCGEVELRWVPTESQLADLFTKALDRETFKRLRRVIMGEECEPSEPPALQPRS